MYVRHVLLAQAVGGAEVRTRRGGGNMGMSYLVPLGGLYKVGSAMSLPVSQFVAILLGTYPVQKITHATSGELLCRNGRDPRAGGPWDIELLRDRK
jgi:hypothetical protein